MKYRPVIRNLSGKVTDSHKQAFDTVDDALRAARDMDRVLAFLGRHGDAHGLTVGIREESDYEAMLSSEERTHG